MKKALAVALIVGFLLVDFLFFHDIFKGGEAVTFAQYLAGVLSSPCSSSPPSTSCEAPAPSRSSSAICSIFDEWATSSGDGDEHSSADRPEEDKAARALVFGLLAEMQRK